MLDMMDTQLENNIEDAVNLMQKDWSGDSSRWSEEKKLSSLDKRMRRKDVRVLDALKAEGFSPKILFVPSPSK